MLRSLFCAIAVCGVQAAGAVTLYDNGLTAADLVGGNLAFNDMSSPAPNQVTADDFNIERARWYRGSALSQDGGAIWRRSPFEDYAFRFEGASSGLSGITFFGAYYPNNAPVRDAFSLQFYQDDGSGLPGAGFGGPISLSEVTRTDTGYDWNTSLPLDIFEYIATFPEITFSFSDRYWFSVVNNTSSSETGDWVSIGPSTIPGPWSGVLLASAIGLGLLTQRKRIRQID